MFSQVYTTIQVEEMTQKQINTYVKKVPKVATPTPTFVDEFPDKIVSATAVRAELRALVPL